MQRCPFQIWTNDDTKIHIDFEGAMIQGHFRKKYAYSETKYAEKIDVVVKASDVKR